MLHPSDLTLAPLSPSSPFPLLPFTFSSAQSFNKALQAPGRALSAVISKLKPSLSPDDFKQLAAFHSLTVASITMQAASAAAVAVAAGSNEGRLDGSSQEAAVNEKMDELRTLLPAMKAIVGTNKGQKNEGDA